jgi:hypothetical protein
MFRRNLQRKAWQTDHRNMPFRCGVARRYQGTQGTVPKHEPESTGCHGTTELSTRTLPFRKIATVIGS